MEAICEQLSVPIPERYHWLLAGVWQKIEDVRQKLEVLQDHLMQKVVLQAAKHEEDAKVQSEGKSSSQEPENKQPMNISEILEKPRDVKGHQSGGREDSFSGSRLRNTATKNISEKANTTGYGPSYGYLLIALAFCTLPPGACGNGDPVRYCKRINQSVNLPAGANVEDVVRWILNPANNPAEYYTLYKSDVSGEILRKDGCGGYHFELNHSIFIASAQPCHAGTYTVETGGDSRAIDLIVNDVAENSTERAKENVTLPNSEPTTAWNTGSKSVNTMLAVVSTISCVLILAIVVAIIYLKWKRKCNFNKVPAGGNSGDVSYDRVRRGEDVIV